MKDMDAYTILYQSKDKMKRKGTLEKWNQINAFQTKDKKERELTKLTHDILEMGMIEIKYEFPPTVFKRMNKYYKNNKAVLEEMLKNELKQILEKNI